MARTLRISSPRSLARASLALGILFSIACTAAGPSRTASACPSPPCESAEDTDRTTVPAASDGGDVAVQHDVASPCAYTEGIRLDEVLYDPDGADDPTREFVEISGPAGRAVEGIALRGIDGRTGTAYAELPLDGVVLDDVGRAVLPALSEPLQNGPDGVALVACDGAVVDAVAWGDVDDAMLPGARGPDVPDGRSLARCPGTEIWDAAAPTPGAANTASTFARDDACGPAPVEPTPDAGWSDAADDVADPSDAPTPDDVRDAGIEPADSGGADRDAATDPRPLDAGVDAAATDTVDDGDDATEGCGVAPGVRLVEVYPRASDGDRGFLELSGAPGTALDGAVVLVVASDGGELIARLDGLVLDDAGRLLIADADEARLTSDAAWVGLATCEDAEAIGLSWGSDAERPPAGWGSSWCDVVGAWGLARPTPSAPNTGWLDGAACPGGCVATRPGLVRIDELLTDPEGTDGGREYVELLGPPLASLDGLALVGINGSNGEPFLGPIELTGRLGGDGRFVLGGDEVPERDAELRGGLQNGPDSLVLTGCDGVVSDAVAWGTFSASEISAGEGTPVERPAAGAALARPDLAADTDDNERDFVEATPTPGRPNPMIVP